ncbi:DedA family protein [bacterium]|nr:DedA family protein [bacterium]
MEQLLQWIETSGSGWVYAVLFISCLLENLFTPFPGDTVMVFGAYLAGRGGLSLTMVYITTTIGGASGFMILYYIGVLLHKRSDRRGRFLGIDIEKIEKMRGKFRRWGWWLIFFNRFFYGVRILIALFTGMSRLHPWKTAGLALFATALWNGILIHFGYILGENWGGFKQMIWKYQRWVVGFFILIIVIFLFRRLMMMLRK